MFALICFLLACAGGRLAKDHEPYYSSHFNAPPMPWRYGLGTAMVYIFGLLAVGDLVL